MENKITTTENVEVVTEKKKIGKGWKIAAGVGAAALVGGLICKLVSKAKNDDDGYVYVEEDEDDSTEESE